MGLKSKKNKERKRDDGHGSWGQETIKNRLGGDRKKQGGKRCRGVKGLDGGFQNKTKKTNAKFTLISLNNLAGKGTTPRRFGAGGWGEDRKLGTRGHITVDMQKKARAATAARKPIHGEGDKFHMPHGGDGSCWVSNEPEIGGAKPRMPGR